MDETTVDAASIVSAPALSIIASEARLGAHTINGGAIPVAGDVVGMIVEAFARKWRTPVKVGR
jgi:hypothetical protein